MSQKGILLAHRKSLKITYKNLNTQQKRIIKALEELEQIDKFYYSSRGFFATCPKINGAPNWDKIGEKQLDLIDEMEIKKNKYNKFLNKFTDDFINQAKNIFDQSQFRFSQSF